MATTNPAAKELYPLSTQKGDAVPLEVMGAEFLIKKSLSAGVGSSIVLPDGCKIVSLYASEECYVDLTNSIPNALVDGTIYDSVAFIPADTVIVLATESVAIIKALSEKNTTLFIQGLRKWAGIGLETQLRNK